MQDKEVEVFLKLEQQRQENHIELIASENFVSKDVLIAVGSILTNKYAEGYPGKRYYGGCQYVDEIETLAIERLKRLFNVSYANVQPHSGSQANFAVYMALLSPGDTIMGMNLKDGGHLTHGFKITSSGTFFNSVGYGVDANGFIDFNEVRKIAKKEKPKLIICGYSSYSQIIDFKKFKEIADEVGAYLMADIAHIAGLVATGVHPSPNGYADVITSTTHKTLRGARGGVIMTNNIEIAQKIDRAIFPGLQGGPLEHAIAGKAVAFHEALQPGFKIYCEQIVKNAQAFANKFIELGATIITGGTYNHMFTINVKKTYGITGKKASQLLNDFDITVNKNAIPNDEESTFITSGIRLGTPAMTTRGFKEDEFRQLAEIMHNIITKPEIDHKPTVKKLISKFPIRQYFD